jgi:hypothetical protein
MKLPYEEQVLRPDALREVLLADGTKGFTLDLGLNYYRGQPLSAVEKLELSIDGEAVDTSGMICELGDKLLPPSQIPLAITEFWSLKKRLRLHLYEHPLSPGVHQVDVVLHVRNVSMWFGNGWGMIDGSASRELELQEAK